METYVTAAHRDLGGAYIKLRIKTAENKAVEVAWLCDIYIWDICVEHLALTKDIDSCGSVVQV